MVFTNGPQDPFKPKRDRSHNNSGSGVYAVAPIYAAGRAKFPTRLDYRSIRPIKTPAHDNIKPTSGDETSPPNSVPQGKINAIVQHANANMGFSYGPKQKNVRPAAVGFKVRPQLGAGLKPSLELEVTLEYHNPRPGESMMVWMKKKKQYVNDERKDGQELVLIDTKFEDMGSDGKWIDISSDIRYEEEAETVMQAVVASDSGQTAGVVKATAELEDAKLGPVDSKGRIVLTYRCQELYTYAQMNLGQAYEERDLLPLAVFLPHGSPTDMQDTQISVEFFAPAGATLMSPSDNANLASWQNLEGHAMLQPVRVLCHTSLTKDNTTSFKVPALPHHPWALFYWLSLPVNDDAMMRELQGGVEAAAMNKEPKLTLYSPAADTAPFLSMPMPGSGQTARLVRAKIETVADELPKDVVRLCTNLTITDASGSTGMRMGDRSVRDVFNELEELRVLNRLKAVPTLVRHGVLREQDIFSEAVVVFDTNVTTMFGVDFRISDLVDSRTVENIVECVRKSSTANSSVSGSALKVAEDLIVFAKQLREIRCAGGTNFVAPARKAAEEWESYLRRVYKSDQKLVQSTYVNFDTDGGNNYGPCYRAIKDMVDKCRVQGGFVNGFGGWVDQHCASRVAEILDGPCLLSVEVPLPGSEGLDSVFRRDMNCWIKALRKCPVEVRFSAGAVQWQAARSIRNENAADVLCAVPHNGAKLKFELPDVSSQECSGAVLTGMSAGESADLYLMSRLDNLKMLAERAVVTVNGKRASVGVVQEPLVSMFLAHDWMSKLASGLRNPSALSSHLRARLQDDLSFNWNLLSPRTAYLGRAKTENRPPISKAQQPEMPEMPRAVGATGWRYLATEVEEEVCVMCGCDDAPISRGKGFGALLRPASVPQAAAFGAPSWRSASAVVTQAATASGRFGARSLAYRAPTSNTTSGTFGAPAGSTSAFGFGAAPSSTITFGAPPSASGFAPQATEFGRFGVTAANSIPSPSHVLMQSGFLSLNLVNQSNPFPIIAEVDLCAAVDMLYVNYLRFKKNGAEMSFFCDVCKRSLTTEPRWHCMECIDYDTCCSIACKMAEIGTHTTKHHMVLKQVSTHGDVAVNCVSNTNDADLEDPLVKNVLGKKTSSAPPKAAEVEPATDMAIVHSKCVLRAFLAAFDAWKPWLTADLKKVKREHLIKALPEIRAFANSK